MKMQELLNYTEKMYEPFIHHIILYMDDISIKGNFILRNSLYDIYRFIIDDGRKIY